MKLQTILLLTGIAAGLTTVSCKSLDDEVREFYGTPKKSDAKPKVEAEDDDYFNQINAHIDRRLNEFNEKEESKLPIFSSKEVKDEFMNLSFIKAAEQISLVSIDFAGPQDIDYRFIVNREIDPQSRWITRTVGDKDEIFAFETFTNGIPLVIPYEIHILYAFAINFNRIAETVELRSYEKLEQGENPAIADLENEANLDEKGNKIDKNKPELKPKTTTEPIEFRVDNRWCKCYDIKLKSICAPAVAMALYVSNEEKTISRADIILDDDSKISFIMDWREQDGIVLPRVVRRLGDNAVFFRDDANVLLIEEEKNLDDLDNRMDRLTKEFAKLKENTDAEADEDEDSLKLDNAIAVSETWKNLKDGLKNLKPALDAEETAAILKEIRSDLSIVKEKYHDMEEELIDLSAKIEEMKEEKARKMMNGKNGEEGEFVEHNVYQGSSNTYNDEF